MLQDDGNGSGFKPPAEGSRVSVLVNDKWMPATVGAAADGSDNYVLLRYDTTNSTQRVEFVASSVMVEKAKAPTIRPFVQLPPDAKTKGRPGKQMLLLREGAQAAAEQYKRRQQQSKRQHAQQQGGGAASPRKKQRTAAGDAAQPAAAELHEDQHQTLSLVTDQPRQQQPEQFVDEHTPATNGVLSPGNQQPQQAPQQAQAAAAAAAGSELAEEAAPGVAAAAVAGADVGAAAGAALMPPEVAAATPKRHSVTELGSNTFTTLAMVAVDDEEEQEQEEDELAAESPRAAALRHDKRRHSTTAQPRTTSARRLNSCSPTLQLQQRQVGSGQVEEYGHTAGRQAQAAAGDDAAEDASPVLEPVPERPGNADCRLFAHLLPGLTLQKGSINAAAAAAVQAGQAGACKEVVRCVLEHMRQEPAADKRVVFFYLLDAVLAFSRKEVEGCGPQSTVGAVFPRTVGAALTQLVDLLSPSLAAAQKMEKTLMKTWLTNSRRGVEASLVQRALEALRDRMAQNDAAWANSPLAATPAAAAAAAAANGGATEQQRTAGPAGHSAQSAAGSRRGRGLDAALLWRMACKLPMHAAPILTFVNLKDGSKLSVTHKWQPDAWPEYSRLPPAAAAEQYAYKLTVGTAAAAAEQAIRGVPETASPWHDTLASWTGGGPEGWLMQHQHQQLRQHRQLQHQHQQEHLAAAQAAAMAERQLAHRLQQQQREREREQQQARGQSTAAGAEPDEFDASLFMGAAGGVAATSSVPDHHHHQRQQQQRMQAPDMLQALGALQPWGAEAQQVAAPPLPDSSPPLPDDGWGAEEEEEEAFGPPPLPPHSPPRDSYALDGEAGTPPPLPPPEGGSGGRDRAPFFVPQGDSPPSMQLDPPQQQQQQQQQQQVTPAGAVHPQALPGWGGVPPGFGAPLEYGSGSGQQTPGAAAYHMQQPGWPGPGPGLPHPQAGHPMLPPGIGVGLALTPAAMAQAQAHQQQQQVHAAQQHAAQQQQMWAAQQQAQAQAQAQQAFFMQAAAAQQQQQHQHMMQHQQLRPHQILSPPAPGSGGGSIRPHLAQHMPPPPAGPPRLVPTRPPTLRPPI